MASIQSYINQLKPEKRIVIKRMRACILKNIRKGFEEKMNWGMISYQVPLAVYPKTYNKQPLLYCSLAAQKNHYAIYMMSIYSGSKYLKLLTTGFKAAGLKLNMGKSCVRFKRLEDLHLPTVGKVVRACTLKDFIKLYETSRSGG